MREHRHLASQGHLNAKVCFSTYAAAATAARRMAKGHRRDRRAFVAVPDGRCFVVATRDITPRRYI